MTAAVRFAQLAAAWRRRRLTAVGSLAAACLVAAGAVGLRAGLGPVAAAAVGLVIAASVLALGVHRLRRRGIDALAVARHMDRTEPSLEESGELLIADAAELAPLARLQRSRAERAVRALEPLRAAPDRTTRHLAVWAASVALVAAAMLAAPGATRVVPSLGRRGRASEPVEVREVRVTVAPPPYTGLGSIERSGWELDVPEGSVITWRLRVSRPIGGAALVTTRGDTLPLAGAGDTLAATLRADGSMLYQLRLPGGAPGDYHRLAVRRDEPPAVRIVEPGDRTTLARSGPMRLRVRATADDDYGVADARIVATLASGSGEAVKFRERTFPITERSVAPTAPGRGAAVALGATLDLRALGLGPGDQLYFYILAHDGRRPAPNEGRSETVFLEVPDTATAARAELAGLATRLPTTSLRSERQIILDTEELLRERPRLAQAAFTERSAAIGADQAALRTRYGELTGAESEAGAAMPDGAAALTHEHDSPENATLLPDTVRATLTRAVAAMWDAERRLLTGDAAGALPFEHRALDALKLAQQATRAYVQRVGFETPPLEPDRTRLTGDLSKIRDATESEHAGSALPLPAVRAALAAMRATHGRAGTAAGGAALDAAGRELAPRAADDAALLPALAALRQLATAWRAGRACDRCAAAAERALLRTLPPAAAGLPSAEGPASETARRYFERLGMPGPVAP